MIINPDNFSEDTTLRYVANSVPNLSGGLVSQMSGWYVDDQFESLNGEIDYREGIRKIDLPALLLVGKLDNLAPTWAVLPAYDNLSSKDKTLVVLGQAHGCVEDHGHGGIVLGNNAKAEVYDVIGSWLDLRN